MGEGLEDRGGDAEGELRGAEARGAVECGDGSTLLLEEQRGAGGEEAVAVVVDEGSLEEVAGRPRFGPGTPLGTILKCAANN